MDIRIFGYSSFWRLYNNVLNIHPSGSREPEGWIFKTLLYKRRTVEYPNIRISKGRPLGCPWIFGSSGREKCFCADLSKTISLYQLDGPPLLYIPENHNFLGGPIELVQRDAFAQTYAKSCLYTRSIAPLSLEYVRNLFFLRGAHRAGTETCFCADFGKNLSLYQLDNSPLLDMPGNYSFLGGPIELVQRHVFLQT